MQKQWHLAHNQKINLGENSILMGILNVTPDSFSDGGLNFDPETAIKNAHIMINNGADIIDIGGESTRPNFTPVDENDELERVLPVLKSLTSSKQCLTSVDTYRFNVAKCCIESGAHIINDIWGLQKDPMIAEMIAQYGAGVVIMHNSRDREVKNDIIEDQKYYFDLSLEIASRAGISQKQIVLDPGFGFGKDAQQNLELMKRSNELISFGFPLLAATSRKRFLGTICEHDDAKKRDIATSATSVILRNAGFSVFRVHNIDVNKDALAVIDAMNHSILKSGDIV